MVADKGIHEFLQVAEEISKENNNVKFILVEGGPLLNSLRSTNSNDNICFLGRRNDIPKIMLALDIFLFPSYREGFPIAVLEAMAGQTPVIGFDIDRCREAVLPGKDGILVPFGDVLEMQKAVEYLIANSKKRKEMRKNARIKVEKQCTKEMHIKKHFDIYKKCLNLPIR